MNAQHFEAVVFWHSEEALDSVFILTGIVNCLHSSWSGAVLWIRDQCWQHRGVVAVAEQCLHSTKVLSASYPAPPASGLGLRKKLGGDAPGTTAPPYDAMLGEGGSRCLKQRQHGAINSASCPS